MHSKKFAHTFLNNKDCGLKDACIDSKNGTNHIFHKEGNLLSEELKQAIEQVSEKSRAVHAREKHFCLQIVQCEVRKYFISSRYRILLCDHHLLNYSGLRIRSTGQFISRLLKTW